MSHELRLVRPNEAARIREMQPTFRSFPALQARLAVGGDALNPKNDSPIGPLELKNWNVFVNASDDERKKHWEGKAGEHYSQWSDGLKKAFAKKSEFFATEDGQSWSRLFKNIGLDPSNISDESVRNFYNTYFQGNKKTSQIEVFVDDVLSNYRENGMINWDDLQKALPAAQWIGRVFGENSSEIITQLVEAKLKLEIPGGKRALHNHLNDQLTRKEVQLLDFLAPYVTVDNVTISPNGRAQPQDANQDSSGDEAGSGESRFSRIKRILPPYSSRPSSQGEKANQHMDSAPEHPDISPNGRDVHGADTDQDDGERSESKWSKFKRYVPYPLHATSEGVEIDQFMSNTPLSPQEYERERSEQEFNLPESYIPFSSEQSPEAEKINVLMDRDGSEDGDAGADKNPRKRILPPRYRFWDLQENEPEQLSDKDVVPIDEGESALSKISDKLTEAAGAVKFKLEPQAFVGMIQSLRNAEITSRLRNITALRADEDQSDPNSLQLSGSISEFKDRADFSVTLKNVLGKPWLSAEKIRLHPYKTTARKVKKHMEDRIQKLNSAIASQLNRELPGGWEVSGMSIQDGDVVVFTGRRAVRGSEHHGHPRSFFRKQRAAMQNEAPEDNIGNPKQTFNEPFVYQKGESDVRLQRITPQANDAVTGTPAISGAQEHTGSVQHVSRQETLPTDEEAWREKAAELAAAVRNQGFGLVRGVFPQTVVSGADGNERPDVEVDGLGFSHGEVVRGRSETAELRAVVGTLNSLPGIKASTPVNRQVWIINPYDSATRDVWTIEQQPFSSRVQDVKRVEKNEFRGKQGQEDWVRYDYYMPILAHQGSRLSMPFANVSLAVPPQIAERVNRMVDANPLFPDMLFKALYPGKVGTDPEKSITRYPSTEIQILDVLKNPEVLDMLKEPEERKGVIRPYPTPLSN